MLSKRTLLIILFAGCMFFVFLLSCFILERSITANSKSIVKNVVRISKPKPISPGLPLRIKIPKISVDAPIDSVGITSDGAVGVPKGPTNVAWFNLGPRPGEIGSAVITGHYGHWKNGGGSVFDDLNKLSLGDKIYVEDEKGVIIIFLVRKLQIYSPKENVPEVFNSGDEKAHLNLITCGGTWIESQKTYSNRLVVFSDKEIK